jgi:hypothetical protein
MKEVEVSPELLQKKQESDVIRAGDTTERINHLKPSILLSGMK